MWVKLKRNHNYSINERGEVRNDKKGNIKKPTRNKSNGYYYFDLYENNERIKVPLHRLVAEAFIPNPENKPTVDHIDGNRANNSIDNLRWASYSEQNSRFETVGVRGQQVRATHFVEIRKDRGGGHIAWGAVEEVRMFDTISECAAYFGTTISNISLRLADGTIGRRGRTRAWLIEYVDSERHTYEKV